MKKDIFIFQFKYHCRSPSLLFCRAKCHKKGFNASPLQRCRNFLTEDGLQGSLMLFVKTDIHALTVSML